MAKTYLEQKAELEGQLRKLKETHGTDVKTAIVALKKEDKELALSVVLAVFPQLKRKATAGVVSTGIRRDKAAVNAEIDTIKKAVISYLKANGAGAANLKSRAEIVKGANLASKVKLDITVALSQLKKSKEVKSKGEKANTKYYV
jgi:hypothetical protein